jgi:hypothetical protein
MADDELLPILWRHLTPDQKHRVITFIRSLDATPRTRRGNEKLRNFVNEIAEVRRTLTKEEELHWKIASFKKTRIRKELITLLGSRWETLDQDWGITKEELRQALERLRPELDGAVPREPDDEEEEEEED